MGSEINAIPSRVAFVTKFQNFIKILSKKKKKTSLMYFSAINFYSMFLRQKWIFIVF